MSNSNKLHIHVGSNIPGYLPESEPACFDDLDSAIEHLRHGLKDQQDYYHEQCHTEEWRQDAGDDTPCECAWCDVATDVEAALSAIAGGDAAYVFKNECDAALTALEADGRARMPGLGWIFSPPEEAGVHHWVTMVVGDRAECDLNEDD